jgi:hypothetical protein
MRASSERVGFGQSALAWYESDLLVLERLGDQLCDLLVVAAALTGAPCYENSSEIIVDDGTAWR